MITNHILILFERETFVTFVLKPNQSMQREIVRSFLTAAYYIWEPKHGIALTQGTNTKHVLNHSRTQLGVGRTRASHVVVQGIQLKLGLMFKCLMMLSG